MLNLLNKISSEENFSSAFELRLTPKAIVAIKEIQARQQIPEEYFLKLGAEMKRGMKYQLGFAVQEANYEKFSEGGIEFIVESKDKALLNGVELDFQDSISGKGFVFRQREIFSREENFPDAVDIEVQAYSALKRVIDPELAVNIVDLGLVYTIEEKKSGELVVWYTTSTKSCPMKDVIERDIYSALKEIFSQKKITVQFTADPAWSPERITPKGKILLNKS